MNAAARLGLFGLGLVAVFGLAAAAAGALAPEGIATDWNASSGGTEMPGHDAADAADAHGSAHAEHDAPDAGHGAPDAAHLGGLALAEGGLVLSEVSAPASVGERGTLSFRILDGRGRPVTAYEVEHDKELHLIVVRSDGAEFRHVHPERDAAGVWSIDWSWSTAGTYRVFADVAASGMDGVTLSRTVQVGGAFAPVDPAPSRSAQVAGYELALTGELVAGEASALTITVTEGGAPVTTLEPYLGAFGHLVALRQGDLGYAHVHPEGREPRQGELSGPDVAFTASVPTDGRYLLYFDFQIDGAVHSVPFVVDTDSGASR